MTTDRLSREHPQVKKVLYVLNTVGFQRPMCLGRVDSEQGVTVVLKSDVDHKKAQRIPAFVTTVNQSLVAGCQALLAHAIDTLINVHRAEAVTVKLKRTYGADEVYGLKMGEVLINLTLMPN